MRSRLCKPGNVELRGHPTRQPGGASGGLAHGALRFFLVDVPAGGISSALALYPEGQYE